VAKARSQYRCSECRHVTAKWVGRCLECGTWGSVDEVTVLSAVRGGNRSAVSPSSAAIPISSVEPDGTRHCPTGIDELDRVLGGGVVPGSVTLLAGDPGVGKSTLLLKVAHQWAVGGRRALYVSGEESRGQIRMRADRTGCSHDELYLAADSDLHVVLGHIDAVQPTLVVVDSVQTMASSDTDGVAGGVTQVRAVTSALTAAAKTTGVPLILIGHVTKDGAIAGPRSLEHLVDVVLHFEGDRNSLLRMVRGVKNRFGAAEEVGCFLLQDNGIEGVADPSGLFLDQRPEPVAGTAITVTLDGKRPLVGEIQALLATPSGGSPRRAVSGIDHARAAMIAAVLEKHARLKIAVNDVYLSTVGGMRLTDPSSDLAVAVALASVCEPAAAGHRGNDRRSGPGRRSASGQRHGAPAGRSRPAGLYDGADPIGCGRGADGIEDAAGTQHRRCAGACSAHRRASRHGARATTSTGLSPHGAQ
jgi:DNA repair protein RadA/Sms